MKQEQAIKFWTKLEGSTFHSEIIAAFENKRGYAGARTLRRYVQAHESFKAGLPLEKIARKTGWDVLYLQKIHSWWVRAFPELVALVATRNESGEVPSGKPADEPDTTDTRDRATDGKAMEFDKELFTRSNEIMAERDLRDLLQGLENHGSYKLSGYLKMARFWEFLSLEGNRYHHAQISQQQEKLIQDLGEIVYFLKLEFQEEGKNQPGADIECRLDPAGLRYHKTEAAQVSHIAQAQSQLESLIQAARASYRAYRAGIREGLCL